jgi:hypothetical protein
MILRLWCIWLVFLFIVVIADARNHIPEIYEYQILTAESVNPRQRFFLLIRLPG